jgi:hypothetical protein
LSKSSPSGGGPRKILPIRQKIGGLLKKPNMNFENPGPDLSFIDPVPKAQILKHL